MSKRVAGVLFIVILVVAGQVQATIIATDNFDVGDGNYGNDTWGGGTNTAGQWDVGWMTNGGPAVGRAIIDNNSLGFNPPAAVSAPCYGQLSNGGNSSLGTGYIRNHVLQAFNAGDKVGIDFSIAARSGEPPHGLSVDVRLEKIVGGAVDSYIDLGTYTPTTWTSWTEIVTDQMTIASAGSYRMAFYSVARSGDWTTYLDSPSYNVAPIPEPSTITLMAAGLVGLLAYAWRKRR